MVLVHTYNFIVQMSIVWAICGTVAFIAVLIYKGCKN